MADIIQLPSVINFQNALPAIPDSVNTTLMAVQPTGGSRFTAGSTITVDLPSRTGLYIDPKSIFIRYKFNYTSGATAPTIRGTPVFTPIFKVAEYIASQSIASTSQYNQVANIFINTNMDVATKYGHQQAFGYKSADVTGLMANLDGGLLLANQATLAGNISVSAPLVCTVIASADHFLPTAFLGTIRYEFTLEALANICTTGATDMTNYEVSNFEVCFAAVDMGASVDALVGQMAPTLKLKCRGYNNQANYLASGTSGSIALQYSMRYKSIENIFVSFSGTAAATALNLWGDAYDPTQSNGNIQLQIANQSFPQLPISTLNNKSSIYSYLKECTGSLYDFKHAMAINSVEFSRQGADTTTAIEMGKFYIGFPISKLQGFNPYQAVSLLSGVDSSLSPILLQLTCNTATATAYNVNMICEYSCVLEIDPISRQVQVIQ